MLLRTLARWSLVLSALLLAGEGGASTIRAASSACYSNGVAQSCGGAPEQFGPGATTNFSNTWSGSSGQFNGQAGMTVTDFDLWGARARGSIDFSEPLGAPFVFHGVGGRAFADLVDTLTVGGGVGSGTVRMQWSIHGANDMGFVGSDSVSFASTSAELNLNCFAQAGMGFLNCNDHRFQWNSAGVVNEMVTVDVPIIFGTEITWTFQIQLDASIGVRFDDCVDCAALFLGRSEADFGSTGELVSVQLFDGAGNELDPALIEAGSGFRYDLVGQDVPEPLAMGWVALAVLGLRAAAARSRRH